MAMKTLWVAKKYIPAKLEEDTFFDTEVAQKFFEILRRITLKDSVVGEIDKNILDIRRSTIISNRDFILYELKEHFKDSKSHRYNLEYEFNNFIKFLKNRNDEYLLIELY